MPFTSRSECKVHGTGPTPRQREQRNAVFPVVSGHGRRPRYPLLRIRRRGLRGCPLLYPSPHSRGELAFSRNPKFRGSSEAPSNTRPVARPQGPRLLEQSRSVGSPRASRGYTGILALAPPRGRGLGTAQLAQAGTARPPALLPNHLGLPLCWEPHLSGRSARRPAAVGLPRLGLS